MMGFHTFDADRAAKLEDDSRYAYVSVDELLSLGNVEHADTVADLGSGTGFYTDHLARCAPAVVAIDLQAAMHKQYRTKGVPDTVRLVTATNGQLPFDAGVFGSVVSTMTFHEFATVESLREVRRVLAPDGTLGIADWSAAGIEEEGPPVTERFDAPGAVELLESAGFSIDSYDERRGTFTVAATPANQS
jgi:ubiquinone/menaquinone biosynthesis C-methylase UbiE